MAPLSAEIFVVLFSWAAVTGLTGGQLHLQGGPMPSPYQGSAQVSDPSSAPSSVAGTGLGTSAADLLTSLTPEELNAMSPQQRLHLQELMQLQQKQQQLLMQIMQARLQQGQQSLAPPPPQPQPQPQPQPLPQPQPAPTSVSKDSMMVGFNSDPKYSSQPSDQQLTSYLLSGANTQQGSSLQDSAYSKDPSQPPPPGAYPFPPPPPSGSNLSYLNPGPGDPGSPVAPISLQELMAAAGGSNPSQSVPPELLAQIVQQQILDPVPPQGAYPSPAGNDQPSLSQQAIGQAPPQQPLIGQAPPQQPMIGQAPPQQPLNGQAPPQQAMTGYPPPQQSLIGQAPPQQPAPFNQQPAGSEQLPPEFISHMLSTAGGVAKQTSLGARPQTPDLLSHATKLRGTGTSPLLMGGGGGGGPAEPLVCPKVADGMLCSGRSYRCRSDSQCAAGARCCRDACGMICKKAVPASGAILPGSLLVASCINPNCGSSGFFFAPRQRRGNDCDAVKSCGKNHVCCFNGCRNECRHHRAMGRGGGPMGNLFGNSVGRMDSRMMMMMMAAAS